MKSVRQCEGQWCEREASYWVHGASGERKHFCEDHAVSFYRGLNEREWDSIRDMIRIRCADLAQKTDAQLRSADEYWRRRFLDMIQGRGGNWTSGARQQPKRHDRDNGNAAVIDARFNDLVKRANEVLATRGKYLRFTGSQWVLETTGGL